MKLKKFKLSEIEEPAWNYNKHPQVQLDHLKRSLTDFSQLKNIVIWEGKVIAGNGLVEAARQLGWEEIQAFDATGLLTEKQAKAFLISDNKSAELALPDEQSLKQLLAEFDDPLDIPGITEDFLKGFDIDIINGTVTPDDEYTKKIESVVYTPSDKKPALSELFDNTKSAELINEIESSDIQEKEKCFLREAAKRHTIF